jgi:hypothetical protein
MDVVDLLPELFGRIDRGVDVAPQPRLRCRQGIGYGSERGVTHDKHVNVAVPAQFAPRGGAEDECQADAVRQRGQCLTDHIDDCGRFQQQRLQFGVYRAFTVGLEVHLAALYRTSQDSCLGEHLQFALHGP